MKMTVNYDSIVSALHTDVDRPVLVGVGVWQPDGERYDCCKHNDEAVLILKKNPSFPPVAEEPPADTGLQDWEDQPTGETQAEAQQDTSLTDEGEQVFGVEDSESEAEPDIPASNFVANEDFVVEDAERDEDGHPLVDDDYMVEVIALSQDRLYEITDWVNGQITGLVRAGKPLSFEAVETTDNGKVACCAVSVVDTDDGDDDA